MSNTDFSTTIEVSQSAAAVYSAVNNVRGWWQGEIEGNTDQLNDEFSYRMKTVHYSKQAIVELIPNEKVVWQVTDSLLSFTQNKTEWTGTKISFEISEHNGRTQLRFTHHGLIATLECYGGCSNGWQRLIQESLFSLITTGEGTNVFG